MKLTVAEQGRDHVVALLDEVGSLTTNVITSHEVRGMFAALARQPLIADEHSAVTERFEADWQTVNEVEVTPGVCRLAGDLLVAHDGLRAMDVVHFASALDAHRKTETVFVTFDRRLKDVAERLVSGRVR